jgi:hypothetical protein
MKPLRFRRVLKQLFTAATLSLLLIWVASCFVTVGVKRGTWLYTFRMGSFYFWPTSRPIADGVFVAEARGRPRWRLNAFPSVTGAGRTFRGWMPLWIPMVLVAGPAGVLWWLDRRRFPAGHCRQCGYDLTGNVSGRCPECGFLVTQGGRYG